MRSRSLMRYRGASFQGNASVSWRAIHSAWVLCNVNPDQVSTFQPDYDQSINQVEANGRDHEQVNGSDVWRMVTQERAPPLAWRSTPLDHVFGDARLRDL